MDSNHHGEIQLVTLRLQAGGLPHITNLFLYHPLRDKKRLSATVINLYDLFPTPDNLIIFH